MVRREFDSRYRVVSKPTRKGDRLRAGIPHRCITRYTGQLSILPTAPTKVQWCTAAGE